MRTKPLSVSLLLLLATGVWLYAGYVKSYLDEEVQTTFFIKRYPSFQVRFFDMFANEGDGKLVSELSTEERAQFFNYCKYRFGVLSDSNDSLASCKAHIPSYLSSNVAH